MESVLMDIVSLVFRLQSGSTTTSGRLGYLAAAPVLITIHAIPLGGGCCLVRKLRSSALILQLTSLTH